MSSTKIQAALQSNKNWTIVEAAREFGNREYDKSGISKQVNALNRVEIDVRDMGRDPSKDNQIKPIVRYIQDLSHIFYKKASGR